MKEPTEKIVKVHFHIGQQFGNKVMNGVDAEKHGAKMDWHYHGVKITWNGVTRICSLATVHGIDCVEQNEDRDRFESSIEASKRGPGRPKRETYTV